MTDEKLKQAHAIKGDIERFEKDLLTLEGMRHQPEEWFEYFFKKPLYSKEAVDYRAKALAAVRGLLETEIETCKRVIEERKRMFDEL